MLLQFLLQKRRNKKRTPNHHLLLHTPPTTTESHRAVAHHQRSTRRRARRKARGQPCGIRVIVDTTGSLVLHNRRTTKRTTKVLRRSRRGQRGRGQGDDGGQAATQRPGVTLQEATARASGTEKRGASTAGRLHGGSDRDASGAEGAADGNGRRSRGRAGENLLFSLLFAIR